MQELIQIQKSKGGKNVVSARELYEFLQIGTRFNDWIERRIQKYGFSEHEDYARLTQNRVTQTAQGRTGVTVETDFALTLDMAKELAMVEGNERGKQARKYFIACEKMLTSMTPTHQLPATYADALRQLAEKVESEDRLLKENAELRPKAAYTDMVLSSVDEWTTTTIAKGLNMSAAQLNSLLCQMKVQYKHDGTYMLYSRYQDKGFARQRTFPFVSKSTSQTHTRTYLVWTEIGKEFIHRLLNPMLQQFSEVARRQAS
ncbi:antA/AntB antirepressor family protein [Dyadobacter sp. CY261]|uniref:antA/AntB antirepressor family protein n=1 Tax=Dyadobacter sp. CY261 TaxID=2907203 RepID=UPI001F362BE6|nr:antA/AntB antirepressor family protein [Dyadobacter sp. CY261]MCF0074005.1 antA/AntB antirepressor family protein [Dyadobacter sp. CY261]